MRTKVMILTLIAVLAASVAVAGRGLGPGPGPGGCPIGGMGLGPQMMRELNLTPGQVAQIKKIKDDFMTATKTAREQIQAKMKEMVSLWTTGDPDLEAIKVLFSEIDALRAEIRDAGITRVVEVLSVLTDAQKVKLREMLKRYPGCISAGCIMGMGPGICCGMDACPMANGTGCPLGGPGASKGCCPYRK